MKITIDNYEDIFDELSSLFDKVKDIHDDSVKRIVKKTHNQVFAVYDGAKMLKTQNDVLKIGVVGQVKAGKSSFLNSLIFDGESILPRAATPMTAGLTVLRYGNENYFEVEYYTTNEWKYFENEDEEYKRLVEEERSQDPLATEREIIARLSIPDEIVSAHEFVSSCSQRARNKIQSESRIERQSFSDIKELHQKLLEYVGAQGTYTPITKCLTITLNDKRLEGIEIVDTPGVNDPVLSRELRTREFLRGCHGVFFLSFSGQFFDSTDVGFLCDRIGSQGIGSVVLLASKFDSVLQELSVSRTYQDNLPAAIDDCQKKLEGQYRNNIRNAAFPGDNPIIDFNSSISYSIYKKGVSSLDAAEMQVVNKMKEIYPSWFSEECLGETFKELSEIDEIRGEYLEKTFKANKKEILKKKIDKYFESSEQNIHQILRKEKKSLFDLQNYIQNTNLKDLEDQRNLLEKVVADLQSDIRSTANKAESIADRVKTVCINSFDFTWNHDIPRKTNQVAVRYKTGLLKKVRQVDYEQVQLANLNDSLCRKFKKSLGDLANKWEKESKTIYENIKSDVLLTIEKNELNDVSGDFNGHLLRNELDEILEEMSSKSTLNTKHLEVNFSDALCQTLNGADKFTVYEPDDKIEKKELAAQIVKDKAQACIDNIDQLVSQQVKAAIAAVDESLKLAKKDFLSVFGDRKDNFINTISEKTNKSLIDLENSMKSKEKVIDEISVASNLISQIEKII